MSEEPLPPSPDELRIRQFEAELASRERITQAAETEINRVWEAYGKIAKLSAVFLVIAAGVTAFLGIRTYSDIREDARGAAKEEVEKMRSEAREAAMQEVEKTREAVRKELDQQFSSDSIKQLIADKAKERIDTVVVPVVNQVIATNFATVLPAVGQLLATNFTTWERNLYANTVEETISTADTNRVRFVKFKDGVTKVYFRMDNPVIERSARALVYGPFFGQMNIPAFGNTENVLFTYFTPTVNVSNSTFVITYAHDVTKTNVYKKVEIIDNKVFMDGIHIFYPQEGDTP